MIDYSKIHEQWDEIKTDYTVSNWIDFNKNYIYEDDMSVSTLFGELACNFEISIIGIDAFKIVKDIIISYIEKGANPFDTHEHIEIKKMGKALMTMLIGFYLIIKMIKTMGAMETVFGFIFVEKYFNVILYFVKTKLVNFKHFSCYWVCWDEWKIA